MIKNTDDQIYEDLNFEDENDTKIPLITCNDNDECSYEWFWKWQMIMIMIIIIVALKQK